MWYQDKRFIGYLLVAVIILCFDQLTKSIAYESLYGKPDMQVLPFLKWVLVFNSGAAFGFLNSASGWQNILFGGLAIGVSVFIVLWLRQVYQTNGMLSLGLVCILGGAIGNLVDRLVNQYVVDFILLYYQNWYFPAFNLADVSITCGALLLIVDSFGSRNKKERAQ